MVTARPSPDHRPLGRPARAARVGGAWALLGLLAALGAGCEPTCKATCKKLLSCEELDTPRVALSTCQEECEEQQTLYNDRWTDEQLAERFKEYKQCVDEEECADIADGACYDEDLFLF